MNDAPFWLKYLLGLIESSELITSNLSGFSIKNEGFGLAF